MAVPRESEGRALTVLRPERGPADGADPLWAGSRFDPSVIRQLADEGYIDIQRTHTPGISRVLILAKGLRAVGDPVEASEPDPGDALTPEQQLLLQTVFDHFHEDGDWPKWWDVGRELLELDVVEVAKQLGPNLINDHSARDAEYDRGEHGDRATLTLPATALCDGSEQELVDFMRVLLLCLKRFFSGERNPRVSSDDLKQQLGMSDLDVRKAFLLVGAEPHIFGGGTGAADNSDWWRDISPRIRKYRGVESMVEYLARRPPLIEAGAPGATGSFILSAPPPTYGATPLPQQHQPVTAPQPAPVEIADEELRRRCLDLLGAEGDYDRAIDQACRVLETRVRGSIGNRKDRNGNELIGTALMQEAFRPDQAILRLSADANEQRGAMELYRGIIAFFRNSAGHRVIDTYTRDDARRFVGFVDLLLGMVTSASSSLATTEGNDELERGAPHEVP